MGVHAYQKCPQRPQNDTHWEYLYCSVTKHLALAHHGEYSAYICYTVEPVN